MSSYGYSSGWCERCGRRRGGDGRCTNCDPWWTSALIQVGAPLLAASAALLIFVITTFGSRPSPIPERAASARTGGGVLGAPMATGYPSSALNTGFPSAPSASFVASSGPTYATTRAMDSGWQAPAVVAPVDPDAARWAELEQLRSLVWAADAAERQTQPPSRFSGTFVAADNAVASASN
jgi:hypothetical protein